MLIKLRFIGLLFLLLLGTSAYGENYPTTSLQQLQQDLYRANFLVNDNNWWICPVVGAQPVPLPREECIQKYIAMLKAKNVAFNRNNIVSELRKFSDENKRRIRDMIPQLQELVDYHPDNPDNPLWKDDF
jgi:hypothetical protein